MIFRPSKENKSSLILIPGSLRTITSPETQIDIRTYQILENFYKKKRKIYIKKNIFIRYIFKALP